MKYLLPIALLLVGCQKKPDSEVYFVNLQDSTKVPGTFLMKFGVRGMTVVPAGQNIEDRKSGHHHLLIDNPLGEIQEGKVVPADAKNIHFGKGQTEAVVELSPGKHTLTLQFADGAHRSYGKKLARTITVFVTPN